MFCDESEDFAKILKFGEEREYGSEEARKALRKRLEDMSVVDEKGQREHLWMSGWRRFVKVKD